MSLMSDILTSVVNAIGADVKAIFAKFDATGKLLKTNLPALTKSDVGLGNVDNTADSSKDVRSATKLKTARRIEFSGALYASGDLYFDGSKDIKIGVDLETAPAFKNLYGGAYNNYPRPSGDPSPDTYSTGTRYASYYPQPTYPWYRWFSSVGYAWIDTVKVGSDAIQTAIPEVNGFYFKGMFIRRLRSSSSSNTANNYKWVPISTNVATYESTTSEAPNVYVGADGVLMRSTSSPSSTLILTGVIGDAASPLTIISHGVDASRIKSVKARVDRKEGTSSKDFVWDGMIKPLTSSVSYSSLFAVNVTDTSVIITAYNEAVDIHGKTVTVFIETY